MSLSHEKEQDELEWVYAKVKKAHETLQKMKTMADEVADDLSHVNLLGVINDIRTRQDQAAEEYNKAEE